MKVEWVETNKRRVGWLGLVTGDPIKAKSLLFAWGKSVPTWKPIIDYGTADDLTGSWSDRDQLMMDAFIDYWTSIGGQPVAFKQAKADTPTIGQVKALEAWQKTFVQPGGFPKYGGSAEVPSGGGAVVTVPQVPTTPDQQACVQTCLDATGVPEGSPGYVFNVTNCILQCTGGKPEISCPPGTFWFEAANSCLPLPPPSVASEEAPKSNVGLLVLGGLALAGVAYLIFRSPASSLQENPQGSLWQNLKRQLFGAGSGHEFVGRPPTARGPKLRLTKKARQDFETEWKRVFPYAKVPDIENPPRRRRGRRRGRRRMAANPGPTFRVYLERVRLNQGGYDRRGQYWGVGEPLYRYSDDSGALDGYVRAHSREEAKEKIRYQSRGMEIRFRR